MALFPWLVLSQGMSKKSSKSKGVNFADTVFVVGLMAWTCYLVGRCRFEGFAEGMGIPRQMIGMSKEAYVELGATELMLYVLLVSGLYFMCKGILASLTYLGGEYIKKLFSWIGKWQEDTLLMSKSLIAFGVGWLLLHFGTGYFIDRGREHAQAYLEKPVMVRYIEKEKPTEKQEAALLIRHAGRYFFKPKNMGEDVSFVVFNEEEILQLEVIQNN